MGAFAQYVFVDRLYIGPSNIAHLANGERLNLELSLWFCQLLLHRTAARLQPDSERLVSEICRSARLIISKFLQTPFSATPGLIDHVYFIVAYAALTLCDYNLSNPLIDQARTFLLHLAPNSDHLAYRIACIISEMQRRYSEAAALSTGTNPASSAAEVMKDALFGAPHPSRGENIDLAHLIPDAGVMDTLVDDYGCLDELIQGYVEPQPAFSAPTMFQQHRAPVSGGALPVSLVPRALHDL